MPQLLRKGLQSNALLCAVSAYHAKVCSGRSQSSGNYKSSLISQWLSSSSHAFWCHPISFNLYMVH